MATEAFVCPHCRTWVEGSGRVVRCPSCGKRFRAEEARLDRARAREGFETPGFDPAVPRSGSFADRDSAGTPLAAEAEDSLAWDPGALTYEANPAPDYETAATEHHHVTHEPWASEPVRSDSAAQPGSGTEPERSSVPWGWIIGIGIFLLFAVGNRVLSGELLILAFIVLVGAQWLMSRNKNE